MDKKRKKALIAMSGGVDSSVAAALMLQEGYECIGCTMKLLGNAEGAATKTERTIECDTRRSPHTCCSLDDVEDARSVARKLGMPYYVFNFSSDFDEKVIGRFVKVYQAGGTPNPCIDCNRYMKFGRLFYRAQELGCDVVVTGHYARTRFDEKSGRWQLLRVKRPDMEQEFESSHVRMNSQDGERNRDSIFNQISEDDRYSDKDQTYVLYAMTQEQLAHVKFPLGEYADKEEVRQIADQYGFVNSHKPDSQDICFVPDGKYADFIERRTGQKASCGDFVDEEGHVLGTHKGLIRYTIGQRRGLGLALPAPLYVSRIDTQKNQVVLTPEDRLYSRRLVAEDFNWIWTPDWGEWADHSCKSTLSGLEKQSDLSHGQNRTKAGEKETGREEAGEKGTSQEKGEEKDTGREEAEEKDTGREEAGVTGFGAAGGVDNAVPPVGYTCVVTVKPRYRAKEAAATAKVLEGGNVEIVFHEPQRALTIGQAVVLYAGDNVVGGGTIREVFPASE